MAKSRGNNAEECIEWAGFRGPNGYGVIGYAGKVMRAHRASYLAFVGDIPDGMCVCHDRNAVRVDWNGNPLGYVPRAENRAVAAALDAGEPLEARVLKLNDDPNPWRRVEFAVYLIL